MGVWDLWTPQLVGVGRRRCWPGSLGHLLVLPVEKGGRKSSGLKRLEQSGIPLGFSLNQLGLQERATAIP